MKSTIFAVIAMVVCCCSFPIFAQQPDTQEVMNAAKALGAQESEMFAEKDAAGIASLFTLDGLMVMLAPKLAVKPGRDAVQKHYESIFAAGATNITLEVQQVEPRGSDAAWAAGTYAVTVKEKTIEGNWFRMLKRDGGSWKIAVEGFARAGAIDAPAASASTK
jgi:uncharacterized protein (TIGR02246 family)